MAKQTNYTEKATSEVLARAKALSRACPNLYAAGRNLTEMYLEGRLDAVYHREAAINDIQRILLRKSKANVLLTGPAGCGKTAIAEGLAAMLTKRTVDYMAAALAITEPFNKAYKKWAKAKDAAEWNCEPFDQPEPICGELPAKPMLCDQFVFELSLTALTAGTKYRGDFEERVQNIINECKAHPEIVVFIDEIHQIISAGKCEGADNAAQMLKPALARRDIRCIGATTTEEAAYVWSDKALARRFNEVKVLPLVGSAALQTAEKIMADYATYHNIDISEIPVEEVLTKTNYFLPTGVFPDHFINVVDETLAGAVFEGLKSVDMTHFNATLSRMTGTIIL